MIKMQSMKYHWIFLLVCVCILYLILPKLFPQVFERYSADGEISSVVIYDGRIDGKDFQVRVVNDSDIEILHESGRSTVSLSSLGYTELDGCFTYDGNNDNDKTYWYDIRQTDGKYTYVGGNRAKTVHLYFETADKQHVYNFDFWCSAVMKGVKPLIEVK